MAAEEEFQEESVGSEDEGILNVEGDSALADVSDISLSKKEKEDNDSLDFGFRADGYDDIVPDTQQQPTETQHSTYRVYDSQETAIEGSLS